MAYTKSGKLIPTLRIQNGEILGDMAKWLNIRPSYLSSTEFGKAEIPTHWINQISEHYHLTETEKNTLKKFANESNQIYKTTKNNN